MSEWETVSGPSKDDGWETVQTGKKSYSAIEALAGEVPYNGPEQGQSGMPGLHRGMVDLRERLSQIVTGGEPGAVYGQRAAPLSSNPFSKSSRAKGLYEQALGRALTPEEIAGIEAEPDVAFEQARQLANRSASAQRREFDKTAPGASQLTRAAVNIAPALAIRTPAAISEATGALGLAARTAFNTGMGGALGASEFVQPDQSREGNAAVGAVASGLFGLGLEGANALRPTEFARRAYVASQGSPQARQGAALADRTGAMMDVAEETLDPTLLKMRSTALQSEVGQSMARDLNNRQLAQQRVLAEQIAKRRTVVGETLGRDIENVTRQKMESLYKLRGDTAEKLFGDVRNATKIDIPGSAAQGEVRVMTPALQQALDDVEQRFPGMTKSITETKRFLNYADRGSATGVGAANISDLMNFESRLRAVKNKGGALAPRYPATGQDKMIARELHDALLTDLAGTEKQLGREISSKLQNAIATYKVDSDAIRKASEIKLGDATTPEGLADAIRNAKPSQLKELFSWSEDFDPALKQKTLQYLVRSSIDAAKDRTLSMPGQIPFDRKTFLRNMGIGEDKLMMLTRGNPKAQQAINDIIELTKRTDKSLRLGASTENLGTEVSSVAGLGGTAASGQTAALATFGPKWLAKHFTGPVMAKVLFDPNGQKALRAMRTAKPSSPEFAAAVAYFNKIANEPEEEDIPLQ